MKKNRTGEVCLCLVEYETISQFYYATITGKARWKHGQAWISAKFNENLPPKQISKAEAFGGIFKSIRPKFLADFGDRVVYNSITTV